MTSNNDELVLAAAEENDQIDRAMLAWANEFPDKPVDSIRSYVKATAPAMAIMAIQSANIVKRYITGGYMGEYQFSVTYRIKPGDSEWKRLEAIELLNRFGDWAMTQRPDIGDGLVVRKIEPATRATLLARYEDNDEDYQILMKMTYERI